MPIAIVIVKIQLQGFYGSQCICFQMLTNSLVMRHRQLGFSGDPGNCSSMSTIQPSGSCSSCSFAGCLPAQLDGWQLSLSFSFLLPSMHADEWFLYAYSYCSLDNFSSLLAENNMHPFKGVRTFKTPCWGLVFQGCQVLGGEHPLWEG